MLLSWELDGLLAVVADVRLVCEAQAGSGKGGEGLPPSCGSTGQDHPVGNPRFTCERGPSPTPYRLTESYRVRCDIRPPPRKQRCMPCQPAGRRRCPDRHQKLAVQKPSLEVPRLVPVNRGTAVTQRCGTVLAPQIGLDDMVSLSSTTN